MTINYEKSDSKCLPCLYFTKITIQVKDLLQYNYTKIFLIYGF